MIKRTAASSTALILVLASMVLSFDRPAMAKDAADIEADARTALVNLYIAVPAAKALSEKAVAILVFPSILKAGFIVGGQYGEGVLFKNDETAGFYDSVAASYGLQAGAQKYGYALFFMTDSAVRYLEKSRGWEIGTGPSIALVDEGMARSMTTTTLNSDIYAFTFDQKGLMAGLGIQGTKVTKIRK